MHASRRRERKRALGRQIGASYKAGNQSRWGEDEGPRTACELHFPMHLVRPLHRESAHDGLNIEGPGARSHVWRGVRVATRVRASLVGGFPLDAWKNAENYTRYAVLRRETIVKSILTRAFYTCHGCHNRFAARTRRVIPLGVIDGHSRDFLRWFVPRKDSRLLVEAKGNGSSSFGVRSFINPSETCESFARPL